MFLGETQRDYEMSHVPYVCMLNTKYMQGLKASGDKIFHLQATIFTEYFSEVKPHVNVES